MKSQAASVAEYLESLPAERRAAIRAVREVILRHLPEGYEECMSYGMIGYVVPHRLYPKGYHCDPRQPLPFANLASQKNYMALYVMTLYGDAATEAWFRKAWQATGRRLDMGKCCVRFKTLDDLPLDLIGQLIARVPVKDYIARVEQRLGATRAKKPAARPRTGKAAK